MDDHHGLDGLTTVNVATVGTAIAGIAAVEDLILGRHRRHVQHVC